MDVRYLLVAACTVAISLAAANPAAAQAHTAYIVEDLGSLGGKYLVGLAINDAGDVAGYGDLPDGTYHAFRWTAAGGLEDLGANGGTSSQAAGINVNGDVVGVYIDAFGQPHGFIAPRGATMRDVSPTTHRIWRVNAITSEGRMAGMLGVPFAPFTHAYRTLADGTIHDLGGEFVSVAMAMNDAGEVTGYEAHDPFGANTGRAFRFSETSGMVDLGTVGGARSSGVSINRSGVVVGWSEGADALSFSRAFRARPGFPIEDLGTLGGRNAGATGVNDAGTIVGYSDGPFGVSPFVYTDADGMLDLRPRIPLALRLTRALDWAHAINNRGQIIVGYITAESGYGTLRLTPVPDYEAPSVTATPDHLELTPPDGRMVTVHVHVTATDNFDSAPACAVASVTNSEAAADGPDPDVELINPFTVNLRATRLGAGSGRTYTLAVRCADFATNVTVVDVLVRVPHDNR